MLDPVVIEQNKRIAIFMGGKLETITHNSLKIEPYDVITLNKSNYLPENLNYHSDWNKLMEVRDYIVGDLYGNDESFYQILFTINNYNVTIVETILKGYGDPNPKTEMVAMEYATMFGNGLIEAMFTAILKFIDWYGTKNI